MGKTILRFLPQLQPMYDRLKAEYEIANLGGCRCGKPAKSYMTWINNADSSETTDTWCEQCADRIEADGLTHEEAIQMIDLT